VTAVRFDDGNVTLAYDDVGRGDPPVLLVHGMSCNRTHWKAQVDHLAVRHRVVAYDQRGHGESSLAADGEYGVPSFVADARRLCTHLGVERPIVIGHSLGGVTAIVLAAEPGFASAMVLVDSTVELPADAAAGLTAYFDGLRAATDEEYERQVREFIGMRMFDPGDDPVQAASLTDELASVPREVFIAGGSSVLDVDVAATAQAVAVPTLFLASDRPWLDLGRVHSLRPDWFVGRTVGAGHFHQVLVPEQVNAMIGRFLECVANGVTTAPESEF
jgi:pimeloyl-ACP methyl ester carboxylesterase